MSGRSQGIQLQQGLEDLEENMQGFPKIFVTNEVTKISPGSDDIPHSLRQRRKTSCEVQQATSQENGCSNLKYSTPVAPSKGQKWSEHFFRVGAGPGTAASKKVDDVVKVAEADSGFLEQSSHASPASIDSSCSTTTSSSAFSPPYVGLASPNGSIYISPLHQQGKRLQASQKRLFNVDDGPAFLQLWADFKKRPHEVVPIVILMVVAASAVVSVCMLSNAIRRSPIASGGGAGDDLKAGVTFNIEEDDLNGKYRSIEFGHRKKWVAEPEAPAAVILDEEGQPLAGKKAALKFGFDMKKAQGEEADAEPDLEEEEQANHEEAEVADDDEDSKKKLKASIALLEELKQVAQMLAKADPDKIAAADETVNNPKADEDHKAAGKGTLERLQSFKGPSRPLQQQPSPPPGSFKGAKAEAKVGGAPPTGEKEAVLSVKKRRAPKTPNKSLQMGPFGPKQEDSSGPTKMVGAVRDEDDPFRI